MQDLTPKQKRSLKRVIELNEKGLTGVAEDLNSLEEKFEDTTKEFEDKVSGVKEELKQVIDTAVKTIELLPGEKGEKGDSYILTNEDKNEIAKSIEVPIVEKVVEKIIEKTETIKEIPIVTNNVTEVVKEVAVTENPEQIVEKVNLSKTLIEPTQIKGLSDIERMAKANQVAVPVTTSFFNGLRAKNLNIVGGTTTQSGDTVNVTIPTSPSYWSRTDTTLSPTTAGDKVSVGDGTLATQGIILNDTSYVIKASGLSQFQKMGNDGFPVIATFGISAGSRFHAGNFDSGEGYSASFGSQNTSGNVSGGSAAIFNDVFGNDITIADGTIALKVYGSQDVGPIATFDNPFGAIYPDSLHVEIGNVNYGALYVNDGLYYGNGDEVYLANGLYALQTTGNSFFQGRNIFNTGGYQATPDDYSSAVQVFGDISLRDSTSKILFTYADNHVGVLAQNYLDILHLGPTTSIYGSASGTKLRFLDGTGLGSYAMELSGSDNWITFLRNMRTTGKLTVYNNIGTVSNGVPSEYATVDLTEQSAAKTATTLYTPTVTGMYRVSVFMQVTQAATVSSILGGTTSFALAFREPDGSTDTGTRPVMVRQDGTALSPGSGNTGNTAYLTNSHGTAIIYAKAGTAIQYTVGYTSVGATPMKYSLRVKLEAL